MFDMSWGEVMLIGGVALVVIGPKDLPRTLRTVGQVVARVKRMAGEFQSQFSEAMREAELDDVRREVADINRSVSSATNTGFNPVQTIRNELKGAVDGVPKPATLALPSADYSGADHAVTDPLASEASSAPLHEPDPPAFDPAAPPAYPIPEPAAEKPSISALAAATAQLKAEAARAASKSSGSPDTSSPDTASTGHTA